MKVAVIGAGPVGLVTAASLADMGVEVVVHDLNPERIAALRRGKPPFHEPGLEELVRRNAREERLLFTTLSGDALRDAEVVFLCVGTPSAPDGSADLLAIFGAAEAIADACEGPLVLVVKSTVPVGTCDEVERRVRVRLPAHGKDWIAVASNPEFLKEGSAVADALRPDRIVVGANEQRAFEALRRLYRPFVRNGHLVLEMDRASSEMTKYAANVMLAARISMVNELAGICERVGADYELVRRGIGTDPRIGSAFLYAGIGYGGSCFPKDVRALAFAGRDAEAPVDMLRAIEAVNERQKLLLADLVEERITDARGLNGKVVGVWGLAFKPNTDDVREAPALAIIKQLASRGASVRAYDPVANDSARAALNLGAAVEFVGTPYEAARGAHALVLATEWGVFRALDFARVWSLMASPHIFDGRGALDLDELRQLGFVCYGVGRPLA